MNARRWLTSLAGAAALLSAAVPARADLITAENLLVNLNIETAADGDPTWLNTGTLGGSFTATTGIFRYGSHGPNDNFAAQFSGLTNGDAFTGPIAPAGITGNGTRSIEVWAYNPGVVAEETLVAWGRRGGGEGQNMSFNYGNHGSFGAVGHWGGAADLGWGNVATPTADQWQHLVYTYDGAVTRVYSNGQFRNGQQFPLNTHTGHAIVIGAQNIGAPNLEPNLRFSGGIAAVRIHDGVLSAADVLNNYNEERSIYGAPEVLVGSPLLMGPKHRYEFSGNSNDSVGTAHGTLSNPQSLATYHDGVLDLRQANNNVASTNAATTGAYVDLPNGTISSLGNQATFEMWINVETNRPWDRIFDFGRSDGGENNSGGGGNSEYIFATTQNGANGALRFAHRSENPAPATTYDENLVDGYFRLTNGVEHHVAFVWDEVAGTQSMYVDGQLIGASAIRPTITLAAMNDVNNWLGRSQWPDSMFDGTFDEFRIYDYALTGPEILGNYQAGANVVNVIPEPSSFVLVAVGAFAFAAGYARKRRAVNG